MEVFMQEDSMEKIKGLLEKLLNRETVLYLVFGVLTTVINYAVFFLFHSVFSLHELAANAVAWVVAVVFAYVTNRTIVFRSREDSGTGVMREVALFFGARLLSFGIDELIVLIMMTWLGIGSLPTKIVSNVVVVIFNYFASKLVIFRKKKEQ